MPSVSHRFVAEPAFRPAGATPRPDFDDFSGGAWRATSKRHPGFGDLSGKAWGTLGNRWSASMGRRVVEPASRPADDVRHAGFSRLSGGTRNVPDERHAASDMPHISHRPVAEPACRPARSTGHPGFSARALRAPRVAGTVRSLS
ncbi:hypothetical protein LGR54_11995 [Ancylobacter sp. Lp-2]|nr:hypothetical protein [Ancylobacter sp. Lp-2]